MSNTTKHLNDALNGSGGGGGGGVVSIQTILATGGQNTYSLSPNITPTNAFVFYKGHILPASDYTLSSSSITLSLGETVEVNDEITIVDNGGFAGGGGINYTEELIATAGQTVFNLGQEVDDALSFVYRNGHLLASADYSLVGTVLTLNNDADLNDVINVIEYGNATQNVEIGGLVSDQEYVATGGQTVFSLTTTLDSPVRTKVYRQGHLLNDAEYSLTTTQLTLVDDADAGDIIQLLEFGVGEVGAGGSGSGEAIELSHNQTSHGFLVGDVLKKISALASKAQADTAENAEPLFGIVSEVTDANAVKVITHGKISLTSHGLSLGKMIYLSQVSLGKMTTTQPSSGIYKAIGFALDSNTIYVNPGDTVELGGNASVVGDESVIVGDGTFNYIDVNYDVSHVNQIAVYVGGFIQTTSSYTIVNDGGGDPRRVQFGSNIPDGVQVITRFLK